MSDSTVTYLVIDDDEVRYRTRDRLIAAGFAFGWEAATGDECEIAEIPNEPPEGEAPGSEASEADATEGGK